MLKYTPKKISHKKSFTRGFTIIETLVAVSIVLIAVTATFSAAQAGLSSTYVVRDQITAMFLAQEAMEGVKNIKDSNLLRRSYVDPEINWLEGITSPASGVGPPPCYAYGVAGADFCGYDVRGGLGATEFGEFYKCNSVSCEIGIDADGFYVQRLGGVGGVSSLTGFYRKMYVEETVAGAEAKIRVIVSKPGNSRFKDFEVEGLMYNWF